MLSLFWVRLCLGKTHVCAELLAMHSENRWAFFSLALIGTNECSGSSRSVVSQNIICAFPMSTRESFDHIEAKYVS